MIEELATALDTLVNGDDGRSAFAERRLVLEAARKEE